MQWIRSDINIDFMGRRRAAVAASAVLVAVSVFGILVCPGPRYGVDFSGGASLQVRLKEGIAAPDVKSALVAQGYETPDVIAAADGTFIIRVKVDAPSDSARAALAEAVRHAVEGTGAPAPAVPEPAAAADTPEMPVPPAEGAEEAGAASPPDPAPAAPSVRVYETLVDESGAKIDLLVSRPFEAAELRDALARIEFEGRLMGDMIGALSPQDEFVAETRADDGSFRYEAVLAPVVNLTEHDVAPAGELLRGVIDAAGLAPAGGIRKVHVRLSPTAIEIESAEAIDRAALRGTLDRTRFKDMNLLVRCASSICPASIDEREQVYGYEVRLRGFGPDVVESIEERLGKGSVEDVLSMEWVGPRVGEKLRSDGIKSILIALALILVYISLRFDLRFAPGAVLCLFHDALITLGFFTFARMEVNLTTIAAVLTIIGYSINDTIVVYDRIRETLAGTQERDLVKVINVSINKVLSRTIMTSSTTILAVTAIAIVGRGTIQDFATAMIVGVLVGTYSSIYVAAPVSAWIDTRFFSRAA
ncbi:MAG: protein translocase subunit SecF [Myxococcota bacterium]|nr:protein translocase subunit SecF [Myxococcota bacterium]